MLPHLDGHTLLGELRNVPGQRRVFRSRLGGNDSVTRLLLSATVERGLAPVIEGLVLHGRGSVAGFDSDLVSTLEGYRAAARLNHPDPRWPTALAAGVTLEGYVYVTTRWLAGKPLHEVIAGGKDALAAGERLRIAAEVTAVLAALHAKNIAFGDLKPANLVLGPGGNVAVIDLDTLREVPDPLKYVPTTDLSRAWAAPEQAKAQRTYLSSDLWAWASLTEQLCDAESLEAWETALAACRAADPLERPRADSLYAHLHDVRRVLVDLRGRPITPEDARARALPVERPGTTAATDRSPGGPLPTERSPGSGPAPTERTPTSGPAPNGPAGTTGSRVHGAEGAPAPSATPPPERTGTASVARKGPGCGTLLAGAAALLVVACAGPLYVWDRKTVAEADGLADEAMATLRAHKTEPARNRKSQRATIVEAAEAAWDVRHTPRAAAVRALAHTWASGWQDIDARWNEERYDEDAEAVEAASGSKLPAAHLAEATLATAGCRLREGDARAGGDCARAQRALDAFDASVEGAKDLDWLRVEATWTRVLLLQALAAAESGPAAAADYRTAAVKACTASDPWRAAARVNGPELLEDCLRVAAEADDLAHFLQWGAELASAKGGAAANATLVKSWPGCEKERPLTKGTPRTPTAAWCNALGAAARGCNATAESYLDTMGSAVTLDAAALQTRVSGGTDVGCVSAGQKRGRL